MKNVTSQQKLRFLFDITVSTLRYKNLQQQIFWNNDKTNLF